MVKKLIGILLAAACLGANPRSVLGEVSVVSSSATLKTITAQANIDLRVNKLAKYLRKHNSPLTDYAHQFVYFADVYNLDYRLVPAISGVESTFGKRIPSNSYNAYGWANGASKFNSWEESIEIVSKTLREKYYDRGADTMSKIASRYAPPSTTWAWKVTYFMDQIDPQTLEFDFQN